MRPVVEREVGYPGFAIGKAGIPARSLTPGHGGTLDGGYGGIARDIDADELALPDREPGLEDVLDYRDDGSRLTGSGPGEGPVVPMQHPEAVLEVLRVAANAPADDH